MTRFLALFLLLSAAVVGQLQPGQQPSNTSQAQPVTAQLAVGTTNALRITRTYLSFASTNSALSTTLTFRQAVVPGDALVVVAWSGNYNTSNWAGTVTDSANHTCTQIAFGVNSTTQFAGVYVCANETAVTSATFTLSGSNSAAATTGLAAYDVGNVGTTLADIVDTAWGSGASSGTAISLQTSIVNSVPNSLVIGGTCAGGTISAGGTYYVADTGVQAPASASNCVDMDAQSVLLSTTAGVTMPFTQGSAAFADVAIIIKPLTLTTDSLPHVTGTSLVGAGQTGTGGTGTTGGTFNNSAIIAEKGQRWASQSNPGSASTASVTVGNAGVTNKISVIDCVSYSLANNGTAIAAAASVNLTITGTAVGLKFSKALGYTTAVGGTFADNNICGLNMASQPGETWTVAFSANATNLLESITVTGYDVLQVVTY
jgi:hypothetical protein